MTLKWSIDQSRGRLEFGKLIPMAGGTYDIQVSGQSAGTTYTFYVMDEDAAHCLARSTCTGGAYAIAFTQTELRRNFEKKWHEVRTFHTVVSDGTNTIAEGDLAVQWNPVWTDPGTGDAYSMRGPQGVPGERGEKGDAGEDGADGADGADGVSPVVTITESGSSHVVKITDATHPSGQEFVVTDGADGSDGEDGEDGADGKSAYQVWLDNGHTGTEAQFLSSLIGGDYLGMQASVAASVSASASALFVSVMQKTRTDKFEYLAEHIDIVDNELGEKTISVKQQ